MPAARSSIFAPLTALLLALCIGAVWPVIGLVLGSDAYWMALLAALVAAFGTGMLALRAAWLRAAVALALTCVSIAYAQFLNAAVLVTGAVGLPFRAVVTTMGADMALLLARLRLSTAGAVVIAAALVLAATIAALRAPTDP